MKKGQIIIHTDGGSRGNPGPAACAFVAKENEKEIFKGSKYLGSATNNFAEYKGVILALEWISKEIETFDLQLPIIFNLDSELVVKQMNGLYKIKNQSLRELNSEVQKIIREKKLKIVFKHVPREKNKIADFLVNIKLDRNG